MYFDVYFYCLILALGLLVGSFLNVCIYRIPRKESIVKGNSHCTNCNEKIKSYDLIPIISYCLLRGKCRNCKTKISARYPLVEFANFLLYALILVTYGVSLQTVLYCTLASTLIVVSMIDFDTQEIPNGLVLFLICLSPLSFFINEIPFWHKLIGFVAASGILFILTCLTNGFGGGDIKLMAACGLLIGYQYILLALFFGIVVGGIIGGILLLKKREKGATMPFGPALSIGIIIATLYGDKMINWYVTILGLTL